MNNPVINQPIFSLFEPYPYILAVVSKKKDGSMKLFPDKRQSLTHKNRRHFLEKLDINKERVVSADLEHGNRVRVVSQEDRGKIIPNTDGLITKEESLFLTVTVADCLPVFFLDPEKKVIGIAHAGRRGLVKNILETVVLKFKEIFQSNPEEILVGVGPGISVCHYSVAEEISSPFREISPQVVVTRQGKIFLDLKKTAQIQLMDLGIKKKNIEINPDCTFCLPNKYFSYRRDRPEEIKSMMALIGKRTV